MKRKRGKEREKQGGGSTQYLWKTECTVGIAVCNLGGAERHL